MRAAYLGPPGTVSDEALGAYERAREPKRLTLLPGGHFDAYIKDFEASSAAARDWFVQHLAKGLEDSGPVWRTEWR